MRGREILNGDGEVDSSKGDFVKHCTFGTTTTDSWLMDGWEPHIETRYFYASDRTGEGWRCCGEHSPTTVH